MPAVAHGLARVRHDLRRQRDRRDSTVGIAIRPYMPVRQVDGRARSVVAAPNDDHRQVEGDVDAIRPRAEEELRGARAVPAEGEHRGDREQHHDEGQHPALRDRRRRPRAPPPSATRRWRAPSATPVTRIISAVAVHTTSVSMTGPTMATRPSCAATGVRARRARAPRCRCPPRSRTHPGARR